MVAGGRFCGTETVAASVDARARSQNAGLADFSEPLPGTLTKDLTRSPTWWGATIVVGVVEGTSGMYVKLFQDNPEIVFLVSSL